MIDGNVSSLTRHLINYLMADILSSIDPVAILLFIYYKFGGLSLAFIKKVQLLI